MRTPFKVVAFVVATSLFLSTGPLWAQGAVINGDFETAYIEPIWTLDGGISNVDIYFFNVAPGPESYCLRRQLGPSSYDGTMEQEVYLQKGITYIFTADIAAYYCAT